MYLIKTPLLWVSIHFANPRVLSISVPLWVSWKLLFITTFPNAGFTTPSFQFALFQITFQFPQSYLDPSKKKTPYSSSDLAQPRSLACLTCQWGIAAGVSWLFFFLFPLRVCFQEQGSLWSRAAPETDSQKTPWSPALDLGFLDPLLLRPSSCSFADSQWPFHTWPQ